jgi:hypothetical protein
VDDLVEFLRARLGEDRSLAQQALDAPATDVELYATWPRQRVPFGMTFDPARVLREVQAKRTILAWAETGAKEAAHESAHSSMRIIAGAFKDSLKALAAAYSDHPDYRQEWALVVAS